MLGLGVCSLIASVCEAMGVFSLRIDARGFLIIGLVLIARVVLRIKMQNRALQREQMIREVPKHPLGIDDES